MTAAANVNGAPRPSGRRFSDLAEALANVSAERDWFAEGAIEGSPIIAWVAPEKAHKSMVAIQLAVATAMGGKWLGAFSCVRPGPVVYLDAEYGEDEFARRLARIARGMGYATADILPRMHHYYSRDLFLVWDDEAADWMGRQAKAIGPSLIVIDPWRNHIAGEENSAEDTKKALHIVAQLRDVTGAVVLIPHHLNKAGSYSGSRALAGRVDLIIEGTDDEQPWYSARGRTIRRDDPIARRFAVQVIHDDDHDDTIARTRLSLRFEGDAVAKTAIGKSALRVLDLLRRTLQPMSCRMVRDTLSMGGETATHALFELRDAGLADVRDGKWSASAASAFESAMADADKARAEGRAPVIDVQPEPFTKPTSRGRRRRT